MTDNSSIQTTPTRAVRLIFEYHGDQVRLVSQQSVDMVVTGADLTQTQHPGLYVDARDAAGRTLARVPARGALAGSAEVFPEKPGEPIVRMDVAEPKGAFTVVVPTPAETAQVAVFRIVPAHSGSQLPGGRATTQVHGAAEGIDLATFPLQVKP